MPDITITAANVLSVAGGRATDKVAGAAITAGQVVYLQASSGRVLLADCDSPTAEVRRPLGIALNGAAVGQPVKVHTSGPLAVGGTMTAGVAYYLSPNPGGIAPVADILTGDSPVLLGIATSTTVLNVAILPSGVTL